MPAFPRSCLPYSLLIAFCWCALVGASPRCLGQKATLFPALDIRHAVVIGVDGMSPDGILQAPTPVMNHMMERGAYALRAWDMLPTSSSSTALLWCSAQHGSGIFPAGKKSGTGQGVQYSYLEGDG